MTKSKKALVVIDMQNDFITGSLGTPEAQAIVPEVCATIKNFDGPIFYTLDNHGDDYLDTLEGKKLPIPHCASHSEGVNLNQDVWNALYGKDATRIFKNTFGAMALSYTMHDIYEEIYICGLCSDICVIANALILRTQFPNTPITFLSKASAGTTPSAHEAAITVMKSCQIDIKETIND